MVAEPRRRAGWDFGYAPIGRVGDARACRDVVVATARTVAASRVAQALAKLGLGTARVETLLARPPLFWTRVVLTCDVRPDALAALLARAGLAVRYAADARAPSLGLGAPLVFTGAPTARAHDWAVRAASSLDEPATGGRWFLRDEGGVAVDRAVCGTGAGTRLAVIDDDAASVECVEIDREVLVGLERAPRAHCHGTLMLAWAVGCGLFDGAFRGVAPDASPRLYAIPKPDDDVVSFPLALARAVDDGADVLLCPTWLEGATSPMLDDALEFASKLGRGGRGCVVIVPTGREAAGAGDSLHSSFSLDLAAPASDPRVVCVAPGARGGGWFFWRDRRGRSRPFANRGPAVRWMAPGDDLAYPLALRERLFHAESSGASAVAAGVALLVLGTNPTLRATELVELVTATLEPVDPAPDARHAPFADAHDTLPVARDRDGHNAKHGHGALRADRACLAAGDPIAWALCALGDDAAARQWHRARRDAPDVREAYTQATARWAVRALLALPGALHATRVLARHARLVAGHEARLRAHPPGALVRQLALLVRALREARGPALGRSVEVSRELGRLERALVRALGPSGAQARDALEAAVLRVASEAFAPAPVAHAAAPAPDEPSAVPA